MKKSIGNNICFFVLGFIVAITISVGAVYIYSAKDIEFVSNDADWKVTNVGDAIDDLYVKSMLLDSTNVIKMTNGVEYNVNVNDIIVVVYHYFERTSSVNLSSSGTNIEWIYSGNYNNFVGGTGCYQGRNYYGDAIFIGRATSNKITVTGSAYAYLISKIDE